MESYTMSSFPEETTEFGNTTEHFNVTAGPRRNSNTVLPVVMLFLFGTLGNILAMIVLVCNRKKHKWRTFYRLVAVLAVSDFIGLFGTLPISMANYHNAKKWVGGQPLCDYMSFVLIFSGMASALLACSMSLDRFLAVWWPHFYNHRVNNRRVNIFIFSVWVFSIAVACLPLLGVNDNVHQFPGTWCFFNIFASESHDTAASEPQDIAFSFIYASIGILAVALMIVMNTMVICLLVKRCGHDNVQSYHGSVKQTKKVCSVNDIYNVVFLIVLTVVFTICWIPLMVRIIINQSGKAVINRKADLLVMRLSLVNQILDPWIYILLRKDIIVKCVRYAKHQTAIGKTNIVQRMNTDDDLTTKSQDVSVTDP